MVSGVKSDEKAIVLVADDESLVRDLACRIVEGLGYRTLAAADGQEALDLYMASPDPIVAAVLDWTMPRMNGLKCARQLKKHDPQIRVIVSSGYSSPSQVEYAAFVDAFVAKPYSPSELSRAVCSVLES